MEYEHSGYRLVRPAMSAELITSIEATMIRGVTTAYVAAGDETFSIKNVVLLNPVGCTRLVGQSESSGSTSSTGTVTIHNIMGWDIDANSTIYATWNDTDKWYEVIVANCPSGSSGS